MNHKKCPKCGENNPIEAVMCWACYTPLTEGTAGAATHSAAVAGPNTGGPGTGPPLDDEAGPVKRVVEPWHMGVIGLFLAIVLFMGMRTLMGGSKPDDVVESPGTDTIVSPPDPGGTILQTPVTNVTWPTGLGAPLPAPIAQFTMVVPPNPNVKWATMAILPTNANLSAPQAAALAGFARQRMVGANRWDGFTIYVFADQQSAQVFKEAQVRRHGEPLMYADYQALSTIWPTALAVYDYSKGHAAVRYPRTNPNGWWVYRPKLKPVK